MIKGMVVQKLKLHNLEYNNGFCICCFSRQPTFSQKCSSLLVKVRYCAVMSDTNMLTASYSLTIMTHDVELALSLKCYQNVI